MVRKYLGTLPGMAVSMAVLACGLWLNYQAYSNAAKTSGPADRFPVDPSPGVLPAPTAAQTSELRELLAKAAEAKEVEAAKGVKVSVAYIGIGAELYRNIVGNKSVLLEPSPLLRARIWENDVHRRFTTLESLPGKSSPPGEWVREMRALGEVSDAAQANLWSALLKSGDVKCATWEVACLWIRAEGIRPATDLSLKADRITFPTRWDVFDMDDLPDLLRPSNDPDARGTKTPEGSTSEPGIIALGELPPGDSILFPLYVSERLIAMKGNLGQDRFFSAGKVAYLPREFSWKDPQTGVGSNLSGNELLAEPLLVSSPTYVGGK